MSYDQRVSVTAWSAVIDDFMRWIIISSNGSVRDGTIDSKPWMIRIHSRILAKPYIVGKLDPKECFFPRLRRIFS